jgi:hypothetical protein
MVRLSKDQLIEGIAAEQARELMRIFRMTQGSPNSPSTCSK